MKEKENAELKPQTYYKINSTSLMQVGSVDVRSVQILALSICARRDADLCNALHHVSKGCRGMAVWQGGVL